MAEVSLEQWKRIATHNLAVAKDRATELAKVKRQLNTAITFLRELLTEAEANGVSYYDVEGFLQEVMEDE